MPQPNYKSTLRACCLGYVTQAAVVNLAPLLFVIFQQRYGLSFTMIGSLVLFNFVVQLSVDAVAIRFVDRLGYRASVMIAHGFSAAGLLLLGILPHVMPAYAGMLIAVFLYVIGGGLIEVLISPIVEACPTEKKEGAMSILHSFYCWGHVFVVLLSTLFFTLFGIENWKIMAVVWAVIPLLNTFYFSQVPIATLTESGEGLSFGQLFRSRMFWIFFLLMACAGASEQAMSQWASAFAEAGLGVSKTIGDLAGPCAFAVCMGLTRALYGKFSDKVPLIRFMAASGALCIVSYLLASLSANPVAALVGCSLCGLSVGTMWPGTFSLAAKGMPRGGTAMFALLALAGDLGCTSGPALVGTVSEWFQSNLKMGSLFAVCCPILLLAGLILSRPASRRRTD